MEGKMIRDMELMRKILFSIEEQYIPGAGLLFGLHIDGFDMLTIAEHCDLLYQAGLITEYQANRGDDTIQFFRVGNLSNSGYDYLESIRNDEIWKKTKQEVKKRNLPETIEILARVAGIFTAEMLKNLNM
jgi:hypothetical protein